MQSRLSSAGSVCETGKHFRRFIRCSSVPLQKDTNGVVTMKVIPKMKSRSLVCEVGERRRSPEHVQPSLCSLSRSLTYWPLSASIFGYEMSFLVYE